jgi:hypothetical protein
MKDIYKWITYIMPGFNIEMLIFGLTILLFKIM